MADDLAIALRVPAVRVVAPIPGKNTVGVEVPNDVRVMVQLKELIDSCRADVETKAIPMFLGKDAGGKPLVVDMCKMPHLLIAGSTGTGKSVCVNALLASILLRATPEELRLVMVDPKKVELSHFDGVPHLLAPVVTNVRNAGGVLEAAGGAGHEVITAATEHSAVLEVCRGWERRGVRAVVLVVGWGRGKMLAREVVAEGSGRGEGPRRGRVGSEALH